MINYHIRLDQPNAHIFDVELVIPKPRKNQVVSLPAWIPGSYMIREFAKNIIEIAAADAKGDRAISKRDKHTWSVKCEDGPLKIKYSVYAWDLSVRMAHFDQTHAYFNGTSLFLKAHGFENEQHRITIAPPTDPKCQNWRVATSLLSEQKDPTAFGSFTAVDYDDLIDHPVEIADYTRIEFSACGVPHEMVITGKHRADIDRLKKDLQMICETQIRFFGEPAPMQRYVFMTMVFGGYGGLEHRASTSLMCNRDSLPQIHEAETLSEGYKTFLGLCSHEYFHTWNVKRIRPAVFTPYDLSTEGYTTLLWAFEGITSYYDDLLLLRAGLIDIAAYLGLVAKTATRILKGSGRTKQSLADSSFDAWTKFYRQDENAPNAIVSYYGKGALVALALDLHIRLHTSGKCSLDCVMRKLWVEHGVPNIGVPEDGIEKVAAECSGLDLTDFFAKYVHGTEDPPLEKLLPEFGINMSRSTSEKPKQTSWIGGDLGLRTGSNAFGVKVLNVYDKGAAQASGISAGDIIIAVDGIKVTQPKFESTISSYPPKQELIVHAFRKDILMVFHARLQEKPAQHVVFKAIDEDDLEENVLKRRLEWLKHGGE